MLVLSRKRNQRVRIGNDIWVHVLHTGRERIKLGFEAPEGFVILREELIGVPRPTEGVQEFEAEVEVGEPVVGA